MVTTKKKAGPMPSVSDAIAGPGQKPAIPQPMPKIAEPRSSGASMAVLVGRSKLRSSERRRSERRQPLPEERSKEQADDEGCIRHQPHVDGPEQATDNPADAGDAIVEDERQRGGGL